MEKQYKVSTAFGLYPFTTLHLTCAVMDTETNRGWDRTVYINKETDVQVSYLFSRTRRYLMSNPADYKEYWERRAATKAVFVRMMGWRK